MNVLLVSQCDKRALTETRRIIDQFAERRGDRTWQTPITEAGLTTLRGMLRRSARKNTSVACHWMRGHGHSELVWIVGDASRFNESGTVPTNTTIQDVLRSKDENDWRSGEDIKLLSMMASLFHDFGKSSLAFQDKLMASVPVADAYRHEWVSLRLFEALTQSQTDRQWLERLETGADFSELCLSQLIRDDQGGTMGPFAKGRLAPLAQIVGWLVVSHHRLPLYRDSASSTTSASLGQLKNLPAPIVATWNGCQEDATAKQRASCWAFPKGLPFASSDWRKRASQCAHAMLARPSLVDQTGSLLDDSYLSHLSRLALMLADHHYSSCPSSTRFGDKGFPLFANTDRKTRALKQRLDEHLVGVSDEARRIVELLPNLERTLPRIARHKGFKRRTTNPLFRWQDSSFDLAVGLQRKAGECGFFGVNLASTGRGKTLANGRIMYGLSDPMRGARFTIALGLRTLTLQTGDAYRERLGLGADDLAVLVGGAAVRELYSLSEREKELQQSGSESVGGLLPDNTHVHFESSLEDGPLSRWLRDNHAAQKLLMAPVLTCTIDHLIPATESTRGGHQIAPILRLLTSDLVLDEPDDFDNDDLPALSRLVHWAGLLGSKVLLSSATLPPALVAGLFSAYLEGRKIFQRHRGVPGLPVNVCCAWFDEFRCEESQQADRNGFASNHTSFVEKRVADLSVAERRRFAGIVPVTPPSQSRDDVVEYLAPKLIESARELHEDHNVRDPKTNKRVSFGLVRMANIEPLTDVALRLLQNGGPPDCRIHLCVYHSRHPLFMRSRIERTLDQLMKRHSPMGVLDHPVVRAALDTHGESEHIFVTLASPVAEVGRDHDYDWAVAEPSSMRSIIQLCGRVRRHRSGDIKTPNVLLFSTNVRGLLGLNPAFTMPGSEKADDFLLESHDLRTLLSEDEISMVNAIPRITEKQPLHPTQRLVDLEHQRLRRLMLSEGASPTELTVPDWWATRAHLSGEMQRSMRFRKGLMEETYALLPENEEEGSAEIFCKQNDEGRWEEQNHLVSPICITMGPRVSTWGIGTYRQELDALAGEMNQDAIDCARRYGGVQLRESVHGWGYHSILGFKKKR